MHPRNAHSYQGCAGNARKWSARAEILADFPDLLPGDIRASIPYAASYLDHTVLVAA